MAVCAVLCVAATGCSVNPVTGQMEFMVVGEKDELALGDRSHPNIIFMYGGEYHDRELNVYLGTIVTRLHRCSHRPWLPVDFTMLNDSIVNAFATPGHVYATRGFLARMENEAQFAFVMGHELTHVAARHSAKRLSNSLVSGLLIEAGGSLTGDTMGGRVAVGVGNVGVTLLGLSYSRQQELQADRGGTYYTALAGWEPDQAVAVQRILDSLHKGQPALLDRYLSTHPPSESRIADIEAFIGEMGLHGARYRQGDGTYADRWNRRLQGLREVHAAYGPYDKGSEHLSEKRYQDALRSAEEAIGRRADQAPFHRLKGDALLALGRLDEAQAAYEEALARDGRFMPATIGLGRVARRREDWKTAEKHFDAATRGWPASPQAWRGLGEARYMQRRYQKALLPLEKVAPALPNEPTVHYMLAVCYEWTSQLVQAYHAYVRAIEAGLSGEDLARAQLRVLILSPLVAPPRDGS